MHKQGAAYLKGAGMRCQEPPGYRACTLPGWPKKVTWTASRAAGRHPVLLSAELGDCCLQSLAPRPIMRLKSHSVADNSGASNEEMSQNTEVVQVYVSDSCKSSEEKLRLNSASKGRRRSRQPPGLRAMVRLCRDAACGCVSGTGGNEQPQVACSRSNALSAYLDL